MWWLPLWQSAGSRDVGSAAVACKLSSCGSWALEHGLSSGGLVAPQHVESSLTRDRTHVPCVGRRILIHRATREFLVRCLKQRFSHHLRCFTPPGLMLLPKASEDPEKYLSLLSKFFVGGWGKYSRQLKKKILISCLAFTHCSTSLSFSFC